MPLSIRFATLTLLGTLLAGSALAQTAPFGSSTPQPAASETKAEAKPAVTKKKSAKAAKPADPNDYTILKVNGDPVAKSKVEEIWLSLFPEGKAPPFDQFDDKMKQNVLRGIASEQLIYQQAQKSGLNDSPEVAEKLAKLKEKLVTQAYLEQKAAGLVSDADVKKAYDGKVATLKGKEEVQARHILVDTEDKAEEIEKQLKDGADFGDLAKKLSLDKSNAAKGGELGWFAEGQMVPEFSKAAFATKPGDVSKPVKTEFGWHVIQVEKKRPVEVPAYDDVKDSIREQLKTQALKVYISKLVDSASIEYFDKDGKKLEFTKAPDTTGKDEGAQ